MGLDWIAVVLTLVSTHLITLRLWHGWLVKSVACVLSLYLMGQAGLVAFAALEVVHLAQNAWGFWLWRRDA
jgi:hypothetical protein